MSFVAPQEEQGIEKVIQIDRINKVVKGGKRMSFRAFVIVGDLQGRVGFALGKSREVPSAIKKAITRARQNMKTINAGSTVPHEVVGASGSSKVIIKPAKRGTGVIAGGAVRILLEACGIRDVVAKTFSSNSINATKAAMDGLLQLMDVETESNRRGKKLPVYIDTTQEEEPIVIKRPPAPQKPEKKAPRRNASRRPAREKAAVAQKQEKEETNDK